jgi:hypothetical protein
MEESKMSTKEFDISGFTRIHVKFAMELEIVQSEKFSIGITGGDTQVNNIQVVQDGDRITINYNLNLVSILVAPFSRLHARITLPELRELNITGAARGMVKGFGSRGDFDLYISGASNLEISDMSVNNTKWDLTGASRISGRLDAVAADIRIAGASRIELKGAAQDLAMDASGASHIDLYDFPVHNAKIRLTGASQCIVNLNGKLDSILEGASRLEYQGQPVMGETRVTGASTLKRR